MNDFIVWLLQSTLVSSVAIGLLALFRRALRMPSRWRYALWAAIAICLLLPARLPVIPSGGEVITYTGRVNAVVSAPVMREALPPANARGEESPIVSGTSLVAEPLAPRGFVLTIGHMLFALWLGGAMVTLLYVALTNITFNRRMRGAIPCIEGQTECDTLRAALGLRRNIPVFMVKEMNSPCVAAFPTRIIITPDTLRDRETLRHTLLHELCHIRQHDLAAACFRAIALAIHWFNPLAWWAAGASRADAELSCDALALEHLPAEEAAEYAVSLLCVAAPAKVSRTLAAAGFFNHGVSLRDRVKLIANQPRKRIIVTILTVLFALVLAACSLVGHASVAGRGRPKDSLDADSDSLFISPVTTESATPAPMTPAPAVVATAVPEPTISPMAFAEPVDMSMTDQHANDRYNQSLAAWKAGARPESSASMSPYETGFAILPVKPEVYGFEAIAILPNRALTDDEMLQLVDGLRGQPLDELTTYQVLIAGRHIEVNRPWTETEAERYRYTLHDEFLYERRNPTFILTENPMDHDIARVILNPEFENGLEEMWLFPPYEMSDEQIMAFIGEHNDYGNQPESEYRPDADDLSREEALAIANTWVGKFMENAKGSSRVTFSGWTESWNADFTLDEGLLDFHVMIDSHDGELVQATVVPKMVARSNRNFPGGLMVPVDGISLDAVYRPDDPAALKAALDFTERCLLASDETITHSGRVGASTVSMNMGECVQFDIRLSGGTEYLVSVALSDLTVNHVEKDGGLAVMMK